MSLNPKTRLQQNRGSKFAQPHSPNGETLQNKHNAPTIMAGHDEIDNTSSQHVTDRHTNNADTITSLFVGGCKLTLMQCEDFTVEGLIGNKRVNDNLEDKGNVMADIIALYSCNS